MITREELVKQAADLKQKAILHAEYGCKAAEEGDFIMSRYESEMAYWWQKRADHAAQMLSSYDRAQMLRRDDDWPI